MNGKRLGRRVRALSVGLVVAVAAGGIVPDSAVGQQRRNMTHAQMEAAAKRYKPGQWVEVEYFRDWEPAEVTSVDGMRIRVKLLASKHDGREWSAYPYSVRGMSVQRAQQIKKQQKAEAEAAAAAGAAEDAEARRVAEIAGGADAAGGDPADPAPSPSNLSPVQMIEEAKKFPVGTKVDVYAFGAWRSGKVQKNADGQLTVATDADGSQAVVTVEKVRAATGKSGPSTRPAAKVPVVGAAAVAAPGALVEDVTYAVPRALELNPAWTYKPAPAAALPAPKPPGKPVPLITPFPKDEHSGTFFHYPESIVGSSDPASNVVAVVWSPGGNSSNRRVQIVDVTAGQVRANLPLPTNTVLRDFTADGKRLLLQGTSWTGREGTNELHVFDLAPGGKSLKHVVSFRPYRENKITYRGKDLTFLSFVDNDRVLTCGAGGHLVLWNLAPAAAAAGALPKAEYAIDLGSDEGWTIPAPQLDAQRTVVAVHQLKGPLYFFDVKTGKTLGKIDGASNVVPTFDDSGKWIAVVGETFVAVWDLVNGGKLAHNITLQHDVNLLAIRTRAPARMLGESFVLLGGSDLLDVGKGIVVWEYQTRDMRALTVPLTLGRVAVLADPPGHLAAAAGPLKGAKHLGVVALPHAAAVERAAAIKPGSFLALQPGMTASIEAEFTAPGAPADIRERAVKRVTDQLKANGITVAEGPQPLKVVIKSVPGQTRTQQYGQGIGPNQKVTGQASVQEVTHSVAIKLDGELVWQTWSGAGLPSTVWLKEGQSIQQLVDEMRANSFKWFDNVTLPAKVVKPKSLLTPGKSKLDATGLREGPLPPVPQPAAPQAGR